MPEPLYIWLLPDPPAYGVLSSVIRDLSAVYGCPGFLPHVTLASGKGAIGSAAVELPLLPAPLVTLGSAETGETRTHCLYLPASVDQAFLDLRQAASNAFGFQAPSPAPHLSLLYGDLGMASRKDIARSLPLREMEVRLGRIAVVSGGEDIRSWRITRQPSL